MSLGTLVAAGAERQTVRFLDESTSIAAGRLVTDGMALFADGAEAHGVAALLTNDQPSVELALGAIASGARLVSLPAPPRAADASSYAAFISSALKMLGLRTLVARDDLADLLVGLGIDATGHSMRSSGGPLACPGAGFELVQFTSGSTGPPKPILVNAEVLEANILAILKRVEPRPGDNTVSWLPLSHDMGLIGMLLSSVVAGGEQWVAGGDVILMSPERFLRRPNLWMDAVAHWSGTFTASPTFGYRLATRSAKPPNGIGSLRNAIVGGEIIRPSTLRAFEEHFHDSGLRPTALAPAYGMAELGLAATITGPNDRWRSATWTVGGDEEPPEGRSTEVVSSGPPLEGYRARIEADSSISIAAPACAADALSRASLASGGWLHTNDTGFMSPEGWLSVTGRTDDVIVVNGRNLHAPTLEETISQVKGVRSGRVTAVGLPDGDWLVALEAEPPVGSSDFDRLANAVRRATVDGWAVAPQHITVLLPGRLPMTSSGKVQRHAVRTLWSRDELQ